jgi:threonine dehydrogenase-like Zn-dependent dehydrogenase
MAAKALGAAQMIVVDKVEARLKEAEVLGAPAVNASTDDPADAYRPTPHSHGQAHEGQAPQPVQYPDPEGDPR